MSSLHMNIEKDIEEKTQQKGYIRIGLSEVHWYLCVEFFSDSATAIVQINFLFLIPSWRERKW